MRVLGLLLLFFTPSLYALTVEHELGSTTIASPPKKVVALDWVLTETLLSLDVKPTAIADVKGYRDWVVEPALPTAIEDAGSRREPNLEYLAQLKPDLILISANLAAVYPQLTQIAPTLAFNVYTDHKAPLNALEQLTRTLGAVFKKQAKAESVIARVNQQILANEHALKTAARPQQQDRQHQVLVVRFIGDSHVRIHGKGSLIDDTLTKMQITNSWQSETNNWGFSTVAIEQLASHQKTTLLYLGPMKEADQTAVFSTPFWKAMQFTRDDQVIALPPIWTFGGLLAAERLSNQITQQLLINAQL
ncbi:ABC transporter substrate-binding protein [Enterovibrio sp. 27052020O]|uniref:ABC transporter substrate-binding protein n=1 Tax=Enterovibrio sp. 27052020O TaxID=3241166 RepID=UPI0038904DDF